MKRITTMMALLLLLGTNALAGKITVFAASSTKLAMSEIVEAFKKQNPNDDVSVIFSSTGKAYAQFTNGFPYDIFIAADSTYPAKIVSDGNALGQPKVYALGVLALYSHDRELVKLGMDALKSTRVKHISIANPRLAPYGEAALEVIKKYGLEDTAKGKLVLGDNIAQSVQFIDSGAADVGLVAFSLIKSSKEADEYLVVDPTKYAPLQQAFVVTKHAKEKPLAAKFAAFLTADSSKEIFEKYGFGTK
jgi:molybdate transport system substrate-binding protein